MADVSLARELADTVEFCHDSRNSPRQDACFEILDEVTDSTRIFASLMRLCAIPTPTSVPKRCS